MIAGKTSIKSAELVESVITKIKNFFKQIFVIYKRIYKYILKIAKFLNETLILHLLKLLNS